MRERSVTNKIKSWVPDVWSTVPWLTSHRNGDHHRSMTESAGQTQKRTDTGRSGSDTARHHP